MSKKNPIEISSEEYVIGSVMRSQDAALTAVEKLTSKDFFSSETRAAFEAVKYLCDRDYEVNVDTVYSEIKRRWPDSKIGQSYLFKLYVSGDESKLGWFIEVLQRATKKRRIADACKASIKECYSNKSDPDDIQDCLMSAIDEPDHSDDSLRELQQVVFDHYNSEGTSIYQHIENMQERRLKGENTLHGHRSGFERLDSTLNGIVPGHFIVVGARPGVGKSTFLINLMHSFAKQGMSCVMFSLEMTAEEVTNVLVARECNLNLQKMLKGNVDPNEFQTLMSGMSRFREEDWRITIDEAPRVTSQQIRAKIKRYIKAYDVDIIFIDYLTLIQPSDKHTNKQEAIQEISRTLTATAKEIKKPIICAAQLNRDSEKEARAPRKSDLRESGQIEQDAHSILLLHRPEVDDAYNRPGILEAHIVKNRFGPMGKIEYNYKKETAYIAEMERFE